MENIINVIKFGGKVLGALVVGWIFARVVQWYKGDTTARAAGAGANSAATGPTGDQAKLLPEYQVASSSESVPEQNKTCEVREEPTVIPSAPKQAPPSARNVVTPPKAAPPSARNVGTPPKAAPPSSMKAPDIRKAPARGPVVDRRIPVKISAEELKVWTDKKAELIRKLVADFSKETDVQRPVTLAKILWCIKYITPEMNITELLLDFLLPICEAGNQLMLDSASLSFEGFKNCEAEKLSMLQMILTCGSLDTILRQEVAYSLNLRKQYADRVYSILTLSSKNRDVYKPVFYWQWIEEDWFKSIEEERPKINLNDLEENTDGHPAGMGALDR